MYKRPDLPGVYFKVHFISKYMKLLILVQTNSDSLINKPLTPTVMVSSQHSSRTFHKESSVYTSKDSLTVP